MNARVEAAAGAIYDAWVAAAHPEMRSVSTREIWDEQARALAPLVLTAVDAADAAPIGEALSRARLALTAMALVEEGFSDDPEEPRRILSALCQYLVEHGAVDPLEAA